MGELAVEQMTGPQQNVHTLFRHQTARKADAWRTSQGRPGAMVVDAALDDLHIPKRRFLQALPHEMADGHDPVHGAKPGSHGSHLEHQRYPVAQGEAPVPVAVEPPRNPARQSAGEHAGADGTERALPLSIVDTRDCFKLRGLEYTHQQGRELREEEIQMNDVRPEIS